MKRRPPVPGQIGVKPLKIMHAKQTQVCGKPKRERRGRAESRSGSHIHPRTPQQPGNPTQTWPETPLPMKRDSGASDVWGTSHRPPLCFHLFNGCSVHQVRPAPQAGSENSFGQAPLNVAELVPACPPACPSVCWTGPLDRSAEVRMEGCYSQHDPTTHVAV